MKLGPLCNYHKGQVVLRRYANQPIRYFFLQWGPNFMCLKCVLNVEAIVATFNPEKGLEGAFSVITNLHVDLCFQIYLGVTPIDFFFIGVSY